MDNDLERRLNSIEDKIIKLNDRDVRKNQFRFNMCSITLGVIIASITVRFFYKI